MSVKQTRRRLRGCGAIFSCSGSGKIGLYLVSRQQLRQSLRRIGLVEQIDLYYDCIIVY